MMSAFMFPIYLATNKIHYEKRETVTEGRQRNLVPREACQLGPNRPERGKANSW